jgi:hypothetical protein
VDEVNVSERANQMIALDLQQKVELYFLALIFTVAGPAIQSAKFPGDHWQWALEIAGWSCLVTAGIAALLRMQNVPRIFYNAHEAGSEHHRLAAVKQQPEQSTIPFPDKPLPQPDAVAKLQSNIAHYNESCLQRFRAMASRKSSSSQRCVSSRY